MSVWSTIDEMSKEAQTTLDAALNHSYLSVGSEFQEEDLRALADLRARLTKFLKQAVDRKDEPAANQAYMLRIYTDAFHHMMSMWIELKSDQMESAWESLVTAQDLLASGLQLRYTESLYELNRRLHAVEMLLFPPQLFVSSSIVIGSLECSICKCEYGECDHLAGRLYMGERCHQVVRDVSHIDHVAIVRDPEDKRLRFPAGNRCSLTFRERAESQMDVGAETPDEPNGRVLASTPDASSHNSGKEGTSR